MEIHSIRKPGRWAIGLGLFVFFGYTLMLRPYGYPDDFSFLHAEQLRLMPFPPMTHALWGWLIRGLDAISFLPFPHALNLLSAMLGAANVMLLFVLVWSSQFNRRLENEALMMKAIAGTASALFLAVSIPFWLASTRGHSATFDLFLLLGSLVLLQKYRESRQLKHIYLFALLYALALSEFDAALLLFPGIAVYVVIQLWKNKHLAASVIIRIVLFLLIIPLIYMLAAWDYMQSPAYAWRGFNNYGDVFKQIVSEQTRAMLFGLPRQGWLIVGLISVVPWLLTLFIKPNTFEPGKSKSFIFLWITLIAIALVIFYNGPLAPWRLTGTTPLLVAPYVTVAAALGLSLARMYGLIMDGYRKTRPPAKKWGIPFLAGIVIAAAGAACRNYAVVDLAPAKAFHEVIESTIDSMDPQYILLTDGSLDALFYLEAHQKNKTLELINLLYDGNITYQRYAGSLSNQSELQPLAEIGLIPFLLRWLETDPSVENKLAIYVSPDFWLNRGYQLVPCKLIYKGARNLQAVDTGQMMIEHREFWRRVKSEKDLLRNKFFSNAYPAQKISATANNLGIFMENASKNADAEEAYRQALTFDANNICALVNLTALYEQQGDTNRAAQSWQSVLDQLKRLGGNVPMGLLITQWGHIRSEAILARLLSESASGVAAQREPSPEVREVSELFAKKEFTAARTIVEKQLRREPHDEEAWNILAMIAYEQNDSRTLEECRKEMVAQNKIWPRVLLVVGMNAFNESRFADARKNLEKAIEHFPQNPKILETLVKLDLEEQRYELLRERLNKLLAMDPDNLWGQFAMGNLMVHQKNYVLAEQIFRDLAEQKNFQPAFNNWAWTLYQQDKIDDALAAAKKAVAINENSAAAWDTLGVVLMKQRNYDEAQNALTRAFLLNTNSVDIKAHLQEIKSGH